MTIDFTDEELIVISNEVENAHFQNVDWLGNAWNPDLTPIHQSILQKIKDAQ